MKLLKWAKAYLRSRKHFIIRCNGGHSIGHREGYKIYIYPGVKTKQEAKRLCSIFNKQSKTAQKEMIG